MQSYCNRRAVCGPGPACSITASTCVNAVTLQSGCLRPGPSLQYHCIDICECSNTATAGCSVTASSGFVGQPRPASNLLHAPECERLLTGRGPPAHLSRGGGLP